LNGTLSVAGLMGKGYTCLVSRSLDGDVTSIASNQAVVAFITELNASAATGRSATPSRKKPRSQTAADTFAALDLPLPQPLDSPAPVAPLPPVALLPPVLPLLPDYAQSVATLSHNQCVGACHRGATCHGPSTRGAPHPVRPIGSTWSQCSHLEHHAWDVQRLRGTWTVVQ
jgi:hypothetical protein